MKPPRAYLISVLINRGGGGGGGRALSTFEHTKMVSFPLISIRGQ